MKEKNGSRIAPVVNMWCAHTVIDSPAMAMVAATRPLYAKQGLRLNTVAGPRWRSRRTGRHDIDLGCPKNQNRCCQSTAPPWPS